MAAQPLSRPLRDPFSPGDKQPVVSPTPARSGVTTNPAEVTVVVGLPIPLDRAPNLASPACPGLRKLDLLEDSAKKARKPSIGM